jgi:hypothetical protein
VPGGIFCQAFFFSVKMPVPSAFLNKKPERWKYAEVSQSEETSTAVEVSPFMDPSTVAERRLSHEM